MECSPVYGLVELGGAFNYTRQAYGTQKQNSNISRTYSGSITIYLTRYTGLEFNYSYTDDIITENGWSLISPWLAIVTVQNKINTKDYQLGVRQVLLPEKFFLLPIISLGYDRQVKASETSFTTENSSGVRSIYTRNDGKIYSNNMFGAFMLKVQLSKTFGLTGQVKTIFPANKFNDAKDNLKYEAGFSWMF